MIAAMPPESALRQTESIADAIGAPRPQAFHWHSMWLQAMRIGDVYLAAVPAEFFAVLGLEIKRRSLHRHTMVCGLSNDYVGYLPDRRAFELGGYQTWAGLHCFAEIGTGEAVVEECLKMLQELTVMPLKRGGR